MEHLLVQRITLNGYDIDLSLLLACTYVETLDLSGPKLMLSFNDQYGVIRDDYGLVEDAELEIAFSDEHLRGGLDVVERFVIRSVQYGKDGLTRAQGFARPIHLIKQPSTRAVFVNSTSATEVINRIMPGIPADSDPLPLMDAWHLLPGERPSVKLRRMANEQAAAIYYQRNRMQARSLKTLFQQPSFAEFHYGKDTAENQIVNFTNTYREELANERMRRRYLGWSMTEGPLQGSLNQDAPIEITRHSSSYTLDALNTYLLPAIDFGCNGWGELRPGRCIDLKFHRMREGKPFDETLPEKVLIYTVAHHYTAQRYLNRVKGGVVYA